ncbi:MAG: TRAP transporter small permease [Desulfovibrio sp.]
MQLLLAFQTHLNRLLMIAGGLVLMGMMCLACSNMLLRAVWIPVKGSFELMGFGGALIAGLCLAGTQQKKGHIAVALLYDFYPPAIKKLTDFLAISAAMVLAFVTAWQVDEYAFSILDMEELSETLNIIYYPFVYVVAAGFLALGLTLFIDLLQVVFPEEKTKGGAQS